MNNKREEVQKERKLRERRRGKEQKVRERPFKKKMFLIIFTDWKKLGDGRFKDKKP